MALFVASHRARRRFVKLVFVVCAGTCPLLIPHSALAWVTTARIDPGLQASSPAEAALQAARSEVTGIANLNGLERDRQRQRAVDLYRVVRKRFPEESAVCAEADFRVGELLRASGDVPGALVALRAAMETESGGEFSMRACYEAAHILRREGRLDEATILFAQVQRDQRAGQHRRDLASLWHAKTTLENGAEAHAEQLLLELVARVEDPLDRLRCYDELILLNVSNRRIAAGVGYFAQAKLSVYRESLEQTERGIRVRNALENMRSLTSLQAAILVLRKDTSK